MMFHRNAGLPVVVVRPSNAYGEDQRTGTGQGFIAAAVKAVLSGREIEVYGREGTIRDYIHVSDLASGIVAALNHGIDGEIYNIGTGIGTSNAGIVRTLEHLARPQAIPVKTKILPPRNFDVEINVLDSTKLRTKTGWAPAICLEDGLRRVWEAGLAGQGR
jgi:UDP-glucose 4-epimerase